MKKKRRKKQKKKFSKLIFTLILLGIIVVIVLIFLELDIQEKLKEKEVVHINIEDGCSIILENLVHQIRDELDCANACVSECYILNKDFYESNFTYNNQGCHACECYCK